MALTPAQQVARAYAVRCVRAWQEHERAREEWDRVADAEQPVEHGSAEALAATRYADTYTAYLATLNNVPNV